MYRFDPSAFAESNPPSNTRSLVPAQLFLETMDAMRRSIFPSLLVVCSAATALLESP